MSGLSAFTVALVIGISDGDTMTILHDRQQIKIRLAEIDTPEKTQPFGARARQSLADLCFQTMAEVRPTGRKHRDRYIAHVTCNGIDAGPYLIRDGLAWVEPRYAKNPTLPPLEAEAKAEKRGLWADPAPVPPWEWRRMPRH